MQAYYFVLISWYLMTDVMYYIVKCGVTTRSYTIASGSALCFGEDNSREEEQISYGQVYSTTAGVRLHGELVCAFSFLF